MKHNELLVPDYAKSLFQGTIKTEGFIPRPMQRVGSTCTWQATRRLANNKIITLLVLARQLNPSGSLEVIR